MASQQTYAAHGYVYNNKSNIICALLMCNKDTTEDWLAVEPSQSHKAPLMAADNGALVDG